MTTIQNGKKAIVDSIGNIHDPAEINGDLSSDKWKNSQLNSSKQNVQSQVSAMNAATAQMVKNYFLHFELGYLNIFNLYLFIKRFYRTFFLHF